MFRNLLLIGILASALAVLLYYKPWINERSLPPRIYDRLPESDIIGQADILDLSRTMSKTMFHFKIPFRDFLSPDFLLSQGKNYGINFQHEAYFFVNETDNKLKDWGAMFEVRDSSKVRAGFVYLKKFAEVEEVAWSNQKIFRINKANLTLAYGADWFLIYQGDNYVKITQNVINAKRNEIHPKWRSFFNLQKPNNKPFFAQAKMDRLTEKGIESAELSLSNDSSSIMFHTVLHQFDSLSFQLKPRGKGLEKQTFTKNLINLHLDVSRFKKNNFDPLYLLMKELGAKVNFPINSFMDSWNGDISFRQGGLQTVKEKYITTELDENFEVSDVEKTRYIKIPSFDLHLSTNNQKHTFFNELMERGIVTKTDFKYRFLFSPPFRMLKKDTSITFHTGRYPPKLSNDTTSSIMWTFNYTPVQFTLDSTSVKSLYGRIHLPLKKLIEDHIYTK